MICTILGKQKKKMSEEKPKLKVWMNEKKIIQQSDESNFLTIFILIFIESF